MAEEPIRKEDIIDVEGIVNGLNESIAAIEKFRSSIQELKQSIKEDAAVVSKSVQGASASTPEGIAAIKASSEATEMLNAQKKELTKIDKEAITLKARLTALESDEAGEIAKLKVAIEGKNKSMKGAARLDDSAEGSINRMRANVKDLTDKYNKLSPALRDNAAPAIKKLTDELKKAESAIGNNTRNVGNYSEALKGMGTKIIDSVKGFFSLAAVSTVVVSAFNKLKEAFASTVEGMNLMNVVTAAQKQMFYDLATTGRINYENMKNAAEAAKMLNDIRFGDMKDMITFAKMEREISKLEFEAADKTKSHAVQAEALNKAIAKQNELSDLRIADAREELDAVNKILSKAPRDEKMRIKQAELITKIIQLDDQRYASMRRNEMKVTAFEAEEVARFEKTLSMIQKAADEEIEINIEKEKKLKDIRDKSAKEIDDIRREDEQAVQDYVDNLLKSYQDSKDKEWESGMETSRLLFEQNQTSAKAENDLLEENSKKQTDINKKTEDEKRAAVDESFQLISGSINSLSSLFEESKKRELSAAGDNAIAREAIERKFSKKMQLLSISQALINGAVAITEIWRKWAAVPGGAIIAGIMTAAISAQTLAQIAVIKSQKFARGGAGILEGAVHASGGVNIPGIGEAEAGEHIGITSRAMTSKYGGRMLDAVSNSINQGKFFEVWSNANRGMGLQGDPYTKKMYELMSKTPTVYNDSNGDTVKEYPNGEKYIIRKFSRN